MGCERGRQRRSRRGRVLGLLVADGEAGGLPGCEAAHVGGAEALLGELPRPPSPSHAPMRRRDRAVDLVVEGLGGSVFEKKIAVLGGVAYTAEADNFMDVIRPLEEQALRYKAEGKLQTN